jgi:hexosaminidase
VPCAESLLELADRWLQVGPCLVELAVRPELPREHYRLVIEPSGTLLEASEREGFLHGLQTLRQLCWSGEMLAPMQIDDGPRFRWRGLMLDSARHFQSPGRIRWILEMMSALKMNVLHWHLTDDQAWRLEIERYPRLVEVASKRPYGEPDASGFYTREDARSIVEAARVLGIRIVPEIEMPAHSTAAMGAYPELTCTGEPAPPTGTGLSTFTASTGKRIYCAGNERSFEFIFGVLDEVMEIFDSPVIHIGGDERPEGIWSACPKCRAVMAREGLASESALQHWFMNRVSEYVRSKGRRSMAWTPTVEHGILRGQIVQDWFFGVAPAAVAAGAEVVNSHDRFTYFDYPNFPGRQKPGWMPDLPLEMAYAFDPGEESGRVLGSECCLWTEMIEDEDISAALFPRMMAFSEAMWSPAGRELEDFQRRLGSLGPFFSQLGVEFAKPYGIRALPGRRAMTNIAPEGPFVPDAAVDGKFTTYFWSADPPVAGSTFDLVLDAPVEVCGTRLMTGSDWQPNDVLHGGLLQVSNDGENFETVGEIRGAVTEASFPRRSLLVIRAKLVADNPTRLAIRDFRPLAEDSHRGQRR